MSANRFADITEDELDAFKRSWPCHGIPSEVTGFWFEFDARGDLVDLRAIVDNPRLLTRHEIDTSDFDGPALVALSQDAQAKLGK